MWEHTLRYRTKIYNNNPMQMVVPETKKEHQNDKWLMALLLEWNRTKRSETFE